MHPCTIEVGVDREVELEGVDLELDLLLNFEVKFVGLERGVLLLEEALVLLFKIDFGDD
jgi:hypothetical protein